MTGFSALPLLLSKAYILAALRGCAPAEEAPRVDVYFFPRKTQYVTQFTSHEISTTGKGKNPAPAAHPQLFGMADATVSSSDYNASYHTETDNETHSSCITVNKVDMVISYSPTVFIAKELTGLDCAYAATKKYHDTQIAIDTKAIRQYIPKLKMEIMWYLRGLGPQGAYPEGEAGKQETRILNEVMASVKPMIQNMLSARRILQSDPAASTAYMDELKQCPGGVPQIPE